MAPVAVPTSSILPEWTFAITPAFYATCARAGARRSFMGHLPKCWADMGHFHGTLCRAEAAGMAFS